MVPERARIAQFQKMQYPKEMHDVDQYLSDKCIIAPTEKIEAAIEEFKRRNENSCRNTDDEEIEQFYPLACISMINRYSLAMVSRGMVVCILPRWRMNLPE